MRSSNKGLKPMLFGDLLKDLFSISIEEFYHGSSEEKNVPVTS